jgi:hypothetical protein
MKITPLTIPGPNRISTPTQTRRAFDPWRSGEPDLDDVLADPIVHQLMARDRLRPDQVRPLMEQARHTLARGLCPLNRKAA